MFLCTDYQPNIPGYVPNDPGYWCCPSGSQCLVTAEAGFKCGLASSGDVPGSTVISGQAPTQASTATTAPTLGSTTAGTSRCLSSTILEIIDWTQPQKLSAQQGPRERTLLSRHSGAQRILTYLRFSHMLEYSILSAPTSIGIFAAQALFASALAFVALL